MEIKVIEKKEEWDRLARDQSFLQSWEWGEILIGEGKRVERIMLVDDGKNVPLQIVYFDLGLGWKYAFIPKFLIFEFCNFVNNALIFNSQIIDILIEYLKKKKCVFLRIEPIEAISQFRTCLAGRQVSNFEFRKTIDISPRATTIIDLLKSEEELLSAMHQKTRYNVRLAEKKGLQISEEKNLKVFMKLMSETGRRDGFKLSAEEHYKNILLSNFSRQLTIYAGSSPLATAIFVGYGDVFTYLFGASDYKYRNLMAPYLVQWEGIKLGKKLGYKLYDFWGIAPRTLKHENIKTLKQNKEEWRDKNEDFCYDLKHQYAGITRFKLGFGGVIKEDPGTYDVVFSRWRYEIYRIVRLARRMI